MEFKYYFALPLVAMLLIYVTRKNWLLSTVLIAGLIALSLYLWPSGKSPPSTNQLGFYLPVFLLGQLGAVLHVRLANIPDSRRILLEGLGLCSLAIIFLSIPSVYGFVMGIPNVPITKFHKEFLLYGIAWGGFVLGTINGTGHLFRLFSLYPLRYLGFISYSIYLWHLSVIHAVRMIPGLTPWLSGLVVTIVTIAVSSVSYNYFEKFFLRIPIPGSAQSRSS